MNEIMSALYARLDGQLSEPVYDHVPQDLQTYPFVKINPIQTNNNDDTTQKGFSATVQIIGYSRYRGLKELHDLVDDIYGALHLWSMADTASYEVGTFVETSRQIITQPDGLTRNSIQQYNFWFDEI